MPNPPHKPTDETRELVAHRAALGQPHDRIAHKLGITRPTLVKHYDEELKTSREDLIAEIAGIVVKKALGGCKASAFFYLKTQAGWRETQHVDHTSSDGTMSTKPVDLTMISTDALEELMDAYGPEENTPIN